MKYKIGDRVIIKSWDEMATQYRVDKDGDIDTPNEYFTLTMKAWCGASLKIVDVCGHYYTMGGCGVYKFTDDMIAGLAPDESPADENVDHPPHYNREGAMECIEEMILVFGLQKTVDFCLLNAWKYRYRAADKNGIEDLKKSDWYMRKFKELVERMGEHLRHIPAGLLAEGEQTHDSNN